MPTNNSKNVVLVSSSNGLVIVPVETPLKRLNYFDGKFLRASDLKDEQDYLRHLVRLSNQAGGGGVVNGFDLTLGGGDTLNLAPGLAINPDGRVLLLPQGLGFGIQQLIDKSQELQASLGQATVVTTDAFEACELKGEASPVNTTHPNDLYLIVISPAEGLCGEEDVYGKLCEEACATSTDRPFAIEGVIVRAVPLLLQTPLRYSQVVPIATSRHLRSRVAAAYFEDERRLVASMISRVGLEQQTWCLGAGAANGGGLPIGVIARAGATTVFLDAWIARRERIDTPPRRYWQWRMMMRPWDVFLAQILQFQCQLRDLVGGTPISGGEDPCGDARSVIVEAAKKIADVLSAYKEMSQQNVISKEQGFGDAEALGAKINELEALGQKLTSTEQQMTIFTQDRLLIGGGIVELPSAGYLPVAPGTNLTINQQVRRMMGEGVELRFCVVRPDYVAHALEEAQHLERISLIAGLDDPQQKPQVDILVPDGEIVDVKQIATGGFEAQVKILPAYVDDLTRALAEAGEFTQEVHRTLDLIDSLKLTLTFNGAARHEGNTGGQDFYAAMLLDDSFVPLVAASFFSGLGASGAKDSEAAEGKKKSTKKEASAEAPSPRIFSRLKTAAARRRDQAAQDDSVAGFQSERSTGAFTAGPPPPPPSEQMLPAGLWLVANCDQDPRKMQTNQTLRINGRAVVGLMFPPANNLSAYVDFHVTVDALIAEASSTPDGSGFIKGPASVFGSIIMGRDDDKDSESRTVNVDFEVSWEPAAGGAGINVTATIVDPESEVTVVFNGGSIGSPPEFGGTVLAETKENFIFGLRPDAEVLKPTNDQHQRAIMALETIGSALKNPSFFDVASAKLFPPPAPASDELTVRGTRDWVMFHRRRNKECEGVVVAPPPPPPPVQTTCQTVYRVFGSERQKAFQAALEQGIPAGQKLGVILAEDSITKALDFAELIGTVSFKAKTTEVVGDSMQNLVNNWNAAGGGTVEGEGILVGENEPFPVSADLKAQSMAIYTALGGGSDFRTNADTLQGRLPPGCRSIAVVMVKPTTTTTPVVEQTCLTVVRVVVRENMNFIRTAIEKGDATIFNNIVAGQFGPVLGNVTFIKGTTQVLHNSLAPLEAQLAGPTVRVLDTFVVVNDPSTAAERSAFESQTAFLRQTFGGIQTHRPFLSTRQLPSIVTCPAVAFLDIPEGNP